MTTEKLPNGRTALVLVIRREASALGARQDEQRDTPQDDSSCCPRCAASFTCGVVAECDTCWCKELPPLKSAKRSAAACYCPQCLGELLSAQPHPA